MSTHLTPESVVPEPAVEAHIHAVEKRERNGKWRVRSVETFSDRHPAITDVGFLRYKHLLSAQGATFDDACELAWEKFRKDPAMRPYMVQIIRSV
jgi:hypothetical protein